MFKPGKVGKQHPPERLCTSWWGIVPKAQKLGVEGWQTQMFVVYLWYLGENATPCFKHPAVQDIQLGSSFWSSAHQIPLHWSLTFDQSSPEKLSPGLSRSVNLGVKLSFCLRVRHWRTKKKNPQPSVLFLFRGILVLIGANWCPGSRSQCRQWHWRKVSWLAFPFVLLCPPHGTTLISHQHWPPCGLLETDLAGGHVENHSPKGPKSPRDPKGLKGPKGSGAVLGPICNS